MEEMIARKNVIERLGKYSRTLSAGFHILIPILDRIAYKRHLKESIGSDVFAARIA